MEIQRLLSRLEELKQKFSLLDIEKQVDINYNNLCQTTKNALKEVIGDNYEKDFNTYCRIEGYINYDLDFKETQIIEAYWRLSTIDKRVINPSAYNTDFLFKRDRGLANNMLNALNFTIIRYGFYVMLDSKALNKLDVDSINSVLDTLEKQIVEAGENSNE